MSYLVDLEGEGDEYNGLITQEQLDFANQEEAKLESSTLDDQPNEEEKIKKEDKPTEEGQSKLQGEPKLEAESKLEDSKEEEEIFFHFARTQPRCNETGELAFDVSFTDSKECFRIPITEFFDLEEKTVAYEEVSNYINDKISVASRFPYKNRKCICCYRKSVIGDVLCRKCSPIYHDVVFA